MGDRDGNGQGDGSYLNTSEQTAEGNGPIYADYYAHRGDGPMGRLGGDGRQYELGRGCGSTY